MELVRAYKLEKYMEIKINKNLFENIIPKNIN